MERKFKIGDKVKKPVRKTYDKRCYPLHDCSLITELNERNQDHAFVTEVHSNRIVLRRDKDVGACSCFNPEDLDLYEEIINNYSIY